MATNNNTVDNINTSGQHQHQWTTTYNPPVEDNTLVVNDNNSVCQWTTMPCLVNDDKLVDGHNNTMYDINPVDDTTTLCTTTTQQCSGWHKNTTYNNNPAPVDDTNNMTYNNNPVDVNNTVDDNNNPVNENNNPVDNNNPI